MCQLSAFLICLWIMTNVWLTLPDWIWLFIEFNLQWICVHLFASELAEEKKKRKSSKFGGSTSLVVIVVMWKSHLKWKCIRFCHIPSDIQNCPLERCFPSAGDSVNILLLLVLHVLESMAERGFSLEETPSERSTQTTIRILQKVPIFRGSDELGGWGFPGGLIHIRVCVRSFSVESGSEGSQINADAQRPTCQWGL